MIKSVLFTLLFVSSYLQCLACGPWYFNFDTHFSIFDPRSLDQVSMDPFYYSTGLFYENIERKDDKNIDLWYDFCDGKVQKKSISKTIYELNYNEIANFSNSEMLSYLNQTSNEGAIQYIEFAKTCSIYNGITDDLWERGNTQIELYRKTKINTAIANGNQEQDQELKKRYYFLALRMTYYQIDLRGVRKLYEKYFSSTNKEELNIIDHWANYFYTITIDDSVERNYRLAQLFVLCPSKRIAIFQKYDMHYSIEEQIQLCKSDEEKFNVYLMHLTRKLDPAFEEIKQLAKLTPNSPFLDYLIVREVNKIENWVLTPRYNMFPPSLTGDYYDNDSKKLYNERIERDKKYSNQLAKWLLPRKGDLSKISSAYLFFIAEKNIRSKHILSGLNDKSNHWISKFAKKIRLLIDIRDNENTCYETIENARALFDGSIKKYSQEFYFAIGRELEEVDNLPIAALFFSQISGYGELDGYYSQEPVIWKGINDVQSRYNMGFYIDYFRYIDNQYSSNDIKQLITEINNPLIENDWLYRNVKNDYNSLLDLLGTKFIREDKIDSALMVFKKIPDRFWQKESYLRNLNCNPFYTDFYTEHKGSKGDTITYTKVQVIEELLELKNELELSSGKKASKIAFKIANCYLNMSYHGNSWIMQNFYWSGSTFENNGNMDDYYTNQRAKKYYLVAMDFSSNPKIQALCLRMAGRCEKYKLYQEFPERWDSEYVNYPNGYEEFIFNSNKYYSRLKNEFKEEYNPLISNCESFSEYYNLF